MDNEILIKETQTLLNMMGIYTKELSIYIDSDLDITIISLRLGKIETDFFVENYNKLLRDFSLILKILLKKKHHFYKNIIFDVNNENKKLIGLTKQKAEIVVERVKFFEKPYEFGYLNPYERMIIHTYVKKVKGIITESQGEGPNRRLSVKPEN